MHHELLLWGQVPARDHDQLLKLLSLYTAMKPKRKFERHIIFKGRRPEGFTIPNTEGRQELQAIVDKLRSPLYYSTLVRDVTNDKFGSNVHGEPANPPRPETSAIELSQKKKQSGPLEWSMEWRDTPIAGGKGIVTQRGSLSMKMYDNSPFLFLELWGWK